MKYRILMPLLLAALLPLGATAQIDETLLRRVPVDTATKTMNMDATYNRPFVTAGKLPVALGGYVEGNWQHLGTDGVSDGHQFQFRRLTLFVASSLGHRLKFLSEIEFEDGAKEIAIEFAALDVELHPLLNLRGGMIMNPIGAFNQNHDGPKWEFTDRPIAMTQLLPATWSNAGFGLYGKYYRQGWMIGYEAYLSGGFDNSIINNSYNKTYLPAAKDNADRFEESASGTPLFTGKVAIRNNRIGELGISYMGGLYNRHQDDGLVLDEKRRLDVLAVDMNTTLPGLKTFLTAEWAWVRVDVPETYSPQYGRRQQGGFMDIVQPVLKRNILGWEDATLNVACRLEYADWNQGSFEQTGGTMGDDLWSIMPAISFRPSQQTVFRINYRFQKQRDFLANPPATTSGFSVGFSSYF